MKRINPMKLELLALLLLLIGSAATGENESLRLLGMPAKNASR